MRWVKEDIDMWRGILNHGRELQVDPMAREAFLSAIDDIERYRAFAIEANQLRASWLATADELDTYCDFRAEAFRRCIEELTAIMETP